jgi:hypothetical protein
MPLMGPCAECQLFGTETVADGQLVRPAASGRRRRLGGVVVEKPDQRPGEDSNDGDRQSHGQALGSAGFNEKEDDGAGSAGYQPGEDRNPTGGDT